VRPFAFTISSPDRLRAAACAAFLGAIPLCAVLLWAKPAGASDLAAIRQEPNAEHRSQKALENASSALDQVRDSYQSSDLDHTRSAVTEVSQSVDLAWESLDGSGKDARRSPKFFKQAELMTRQLLRRIDALRTSMSFEDRPLIERLRERVNAVHEDLIQSIMGPGKK
jgi:hypothetical protein